MRLFLCILLFLLLSGCASNELDFQVRCESYAVETIHPIIFGSEVCTGGSRLSFVNATHYGCVIDNCAYEVS